MLKLIYYRHNRKQHMDAMKESRINFCELTAVLEGEMTYSVNGLPIRMEKGDMIFLHRGETRSREAVSDCDYISFNALSDEEFVLPRLIHHGMNETVRMILRTVENVSKTAKDLHDDRYSDLFHCLIRQLQSDWKTEAEPPLVTRIKQYIQANYRRKITLGDIAAATYFSPVYCETVFKKQTGQAIVDYLIDCRMEEAKSLLWEEGKSLGSIAQYLGFEDYNYFSRLFKKRTGLTPTQYQKTVVIHGKYLR